MQRANFIRGTTLFFLFMESVGAISSFSGHHAPVFGKISAARTFRSFNADKAWEPTLHNHLLSLPFNPPVQKLPSMTTSLDGLSAGEPSSLSGFFMYSSFSLPFSVQVVLIISVFHGFVKTKKIKIFLGRTETAPWGGRGAGDKCGKNLSFSVDDERGRILRMDLY